MVFLDFSLKVLVDIMNHPPFLFHQILAKRQTYILKMNLLVKMMIIDVMPTANVNAKVDAKAGAKVSAKIETKVSAKI